MSAKVLGTAASSEDKAWSGIEKHKNDSVRSGQWGWHFDLDAGWKHSVLLKVFHLDVYFVLEGSDEGFVDVGYMVVVYLFQMQKNAENVCLL